MNQHKKYITNKQTLDSERNNRSGDFHTTTQRMISSWGEARAEDQTDRDTLGWKIMMKNTVPQLSRSQTRYTERKQISDAEARNTSSILLGGATQRESSSRFSGVDRLIIQPSEFCIHYTPFPPASNTITIPRNTWTTNILNMKQIKYLYFKIISFDLSNLVVVIKQHAIAIRQPTTRLHYILVHVVHC